MSSMIEDRRPFAAAMQNYHLMDVDATESQASLNIPEDNGKKYRAERPQFLGINWRMLCSVISIIFFILTLLLFIGTIVAYYNRPTNDALQANTGDASSNSAPGYTGKDGHSTTTESPPNRNGEGFIDPSKSAEPPETKFETEKWSVTTFNGKRVKPGELILSEEFTTFNESWFHFTGSMDSNFYFHVNNNSTSFVKDGILHLKPVYSEDRFGKAYMENGTLLLGIHPSERCMNGSSVCWKNPGSIVHPIMAPMLMSKNYFKFKYGKLLIKARMPKGDWIEPIISLQPDDPFYGDDLKSGQIHFVDVRGNRKLFNLDGVNVGSEQTCPDIRYGTNANKKVLYYCLNTDEDEGFDRDFHIYELEWTPESITIKIDGEGIVGGPFPRPSMYKLWSKGKSISNPWGLAENPKLAPFDKEFSLVMGVSVGGTNGFFNDEFNNTAYPKPWNNTDEDAAKKFWDARNLWEPSWANDGSSLQIDFIRLYALNETMSD
ncbi:Beta-1,3-glucan-binding protein [Orchesella cincta]|uniref:Beta-1,3-glucan-binding protein n=1 Tax=Orchesella cincta TaxID=48709 RepID=A0A1D2N6H3_ORCCI|nr:Beta-1,3-glucan-binding protein [Orchesella cincta]